MPELRGQLNKDTKEACSFMIFKLRKNVTKAFQCSRAAASGIWQSGNSNRDDERYSKTIFLKWEIVKTMFHARTDP